MAYLLRLIALCFIFSAVSAHAAVPKVTEYLSYRDSREENPNGWASSVEDSVVKWCSLVAPTRFDGYSLVSCVSSGDGGYKVVLKNTSNGSIVESRDGLYRATRYACPANSSESNGACSCSTGFVEKAGKCEKPKDEVCGPLQGMSIGITSMESDFGPQSAKWAAGKLGQSGNACMTGCQTSGTISSCVAGSGKSSSTVCYLSNPTFTGEACTDPSTGGSGGEGTEGGKDKPQDCPVGYEASKYAPGVCIPKENNCPSGSSPSKYVEGICIPDEKGDDGSCEDPKDPTKRAECEGKGNQCPSGQVQSTTQTNTCVPAKDGADKGKDGSKVECKDGKCTVTKPDGPKEDKGQDEVCKEQPDLAMCKESKGQFSGSCSASFRCDGDVLQCAALQEQHKRNCTIFDIENDMSRLFDADAKKPQENVLTANGTEIDLKGHITVDSIIGNGQCPADVPLQVFGKTVVFKLSEFCRYFNAMGMLLFLSTCATCLRILGT